MKRNVTFIAAIVLILFATIATMFLLVTSVGADSGEHERYVSEWRYVPGGEYIEFKHGLGNRPLIVQVWAGLHTARGINAEPGDAVPGYQVKINVVTVNWESIILYVGSDDGQTIQVVAER